MNIQQVSEKCSENRIFLDKEMLGDINERQCLLWSENVKVNRNYGGEAINIFSNTFEEVFRDQQGTLSKGVDGKLTLVRGSSLSLVELPTFLSSPVQLGCINTSSSTASLTPSQGISLSQAIAEYTLNTKGATVLQKKSQWIIIIAALSFFTACLVLVMTMLSVVTDYQDQAMAKVINISNTHYMYRMDILASNSSLI
jgi:hypothetical protein